MPRYMVEHEFAPKPDAPSSETILRMAQQNDLLGAPITEVTALNPYF